MKRKSNKSSPRRSAKNITVRTGLAGYPGLGPTVTLTMTVDEAAAILYAAGYGGIDGMELGDIGIALDDSGEFGPGVPGLLKRVRAKYLSKKAA